MKLINVDTFESGDYGIGLKRSASQATKKSKRRGSMLVRKRPGGSEPRNNDEGDPAANEEEGGEASQHHKGDSGEITRKKLIVSTFEES